MAEKSAKNLVDAIDASRRQPLERLIFGLGIRLVGKTVARDLAQAMGSMDDLMGADEERLTAIPSIGPAIAESVNAFFSKPKNREIIDALRARNLRFETEKREKASQALAGITFVLTGTLPTMSRQQASELIESHGGEVSGSVSKKTGFVLAGESAGSKLDKARTLGVPVIGEEDLIAMIGG